MKNKNSTNMLINIKNIYNNTIYTIDNLAIKILKLENVNLQLTEEQELVRIAYLLSNNLQEIFLNLKLQHFTNNIDVSELIERLNNNILIADSFEKKSFLQKFKDYIYNESLDNNIFEEDTIVIIWEKYYTTNDLLKLEKRIIDITTEFQNSNNFVKELNTSELIKICNMCTNNTDTCNYNSTDIAFL